MGELAIIETTAQPEPPQRTERFQVIDPIPVLDTARFEQMQRIAMAMARSSMTPDALCTEWNGQYSNGKKVLVKLAPETIVANCFLVVNQAVRWGMDPFAVAQCVSIVHGKLCYEGKLIAAVLDAKLGVQLIPEYGDENGDALSVTIYAYDEDGAAIVNPRTNEPLTIKGTVAEWRTRNDGSPWADAKNFKRQLMYRGSREWARIYRPAIMLGVYAPDEMEDLGNSARATIAHDVTPKQHRAPAPSQSEVQGHEAEKRTVVRHRAPPPPPITEAPAPVNDSAPIEEAPPTFDADAVRKRFAIRAAQARDEDELNNAWEEIVTPVQDEFFPPDLAEIEKIHRFRRAELDDGP